MTRRLVAQLGFAAFALATVSGVASADSSVVPVASDNNFNQTHQQTHESVVDVTTNNTTTVTVSADYSQESSVSKSDVAKPTRAESNASIQPVAQVDDSNHNQVNRSDSDESRGGAVIRDAMNDTTDSNASFIGSDYIQPNSSPISFNGMSAADVKTMVAQTTPGDATATPAPRPAPSAPSTPLGLLDELHVLTTNTVIPVLHLLVDSSAAYGLNLIVIILALTALSLATVRPLNTYTARLRRGGYLGAARSDIGGTVFFFATPPKWAYSVARAT